MSNQLKKVTIIGAGLAGSEAAWQVASRGFKVDLYEMRPQVMTKAHRTSLCAELVCSNSLGGAEPSHAKGILKDELRLFGSLIMQAADAARVPAGGAFAVDRELFSRTVDKALRSHPNINFCTQEVTVIPEASRQSPVIIASGPLTSKPLAAAIEKFTGEGSLAFFDAIGPIILGDSINEEKTFRQSRYDKGSGSDYINIPLDEAQYYAFVDAIEQGEKYGGHDEVESDCIENADGKKLSVFEGCMPIEEIVSRGRDNLRFGAFKPVGLMDPHSGKQPFAVVQLRQDNREGTLWSMVCMQTRLKHTEQLRIFRTLPGLEEAEFVRLGSVHRNTFINSPLCLNASLESRRQQGLLFAGQLTGVEGYIESTVAGAVAGVNSLRMLLDKEPLSFPQQTLAGALLAYISEAERKDFQPMNASFGLLPQYCEKVLSKEKRKLGGKRGIRSLAGQSCCQLLKEFLETNELSPTVASSLL